MLAHGLRLEILADDGLVVPGQDIRVSMSVGDRGRPVSVSSVSLNGFEGPATCPSGQIEVGAVYRCDVSMRIPNQAKTTRPYWKRLSNAERYEFEPDAPFGLPFMPTPFRASIALAAEGTTLTVDRPVQFRYEGGNLEGEKRMELTVVPRLAVRVAPPIAIVPAGRGASAAIDREVRVTGDEPWQRSRQRRSPDESTRVRQQRDGGKPAAVEAAKPEWSTAPAAQPVTFTREDESQTVRFLLRPGAKAALRDYVVTRRRRPILRSSSRACRLSSTPHIRRRQLEIPASVSVKVMDVRLAPNLTVGYVMGTGDEVPAALRVWGPRCRCSMKMRYRGQSSTATMAIFIGVRAYDSRRTFAPTTNDPDYAAPPRNGHRSVQPRQHLDAYAPLRPDSATRA